MLWDVQIPKLGMKAGKTDTSREGNFLIQVSTKNKREREKPQDRSTAITEADSQYATGHQRQHATRMRSGDPKSGLEGLPPRYTFDAAESHRGLDTPPPPPPHPKKNPPPQPTPPPPPPPPPPKTPPTPPPQKPPTPQTPKKTTPKNTPPPPPPPPPPQVFGKESTKAFSLAETAVTFPAKGGLGLQKTGGNVP